jgi:hypothetical protein
MAVTVTNEYYPEFDEREQFVSGYRSSASIHGHHALVTIGRIDDLEMDIYQVRGLAEVLDAAAELLIENGATVA